MPMGQNGTMRFWSATVLLLLCLAVVGCRDEVVVGGKPAPKVYKRVVSLSPNTSEILGWLPTIESFKGRTQSCNYPQSISSVPVVGSVKPNYEKLAEIQPDLILYDGSLYTDDDIAKLKQLPGVELFPMKVNTVDAYIDWLYRFGAKIGQETTVSEFVDKVVAARERAAGSPPNPRPRVLVLMGEPQLGYMAAGTKSFVADVVKCAGGDPLGPDSEKYEPANIESLLSMNPDAIVTGGDALAILKDPRLASVKAVRSKAVARIDPDVLYRTGQRVDRLIEALYVFFSNQTAR